MDLLAVGVAEDLEDAFFLELIGIPQRVGARRRAPCDRPNQVGLSGAYLYPLKAAACTSLTVSQILVSVPSGAAWAT
jgi:hypothetical protein